VASLLVKLLGDSTSLERAFKRANASAGTFNKNATKSSKTATKTQGAMRGLGRTVAIAGGGYLGAAGLAAAVRTSWQEMSESAKVGAQTNAVLKSTGGAAKITAAEITALGDAQLRKTGIDDEAIKTGLNMLLTFKQIKNNQGANRDIFNQTAQAVLDMDVAMTQGNSTSQSLAKTAIRVGKALNDPIKGASALARVGVQLTEEQKKTIKELIKGKDPIDALYSLYPNLTYEQTRTAKSMFKLGSTIDDVTKKVGLKYTAAQQKAYNKMTEGGKYVAAQRIILQELNAEFGGSATALGTTLPGKIAIARESFKNLGGTLAVQLVPAVTKAVTAVTKFISNAQNQKAIIDGFRTTLAAVSTTLTVVRTAFNGLSRVVGGSRNALVVLIGAFVAFKALNMAATVLGIARSFGVLTGRTTAATAATRTFNLSMIGKAGLVGAVGLAAFGITSMILKLTGLDKKLKGVGATAFDVASKLGLVNDPTAKFAGKRNIGQAEARRLRATAGRLQQQGLSPNASAAQLIRQHPNLAAQDLRVLAGATTGRGVPVNLVVNLDGQTVARVTTEAQNKAKKRNTTQRRGRISGR
jgi:hypothetical protein